MLTRFETFRRRSLSAVALAAVAIGILFLGASSASALSKNTFSNSFAGAGDTALSDPSDVAVDQQSHDVYVTDPENARIVKFDSSGNFVLMFGNSVNKSKVELRTEELNRHEPVTVTEAEENVCTAASGDTCQAGRSGKGAQAPLASQFTSPKFIAVDNSGGLSDGDVYVLDPGEEIIFKFDPAGQPITSWSRAGQFSLNFSYNPHFRDDVPSGLYGEGSPATEGLAVAANGDLLFGYYAIFRFGQFGGFISSFLPPIPGRIAVGPNGELVDASTDGSVHRLSSTGADLGHLTGAGFGGPATALASDLGKDQVYVADGGSIIRHYGGDCETPTSGCLATDSFGNGELGNVTGLAVDESSGVVYAADQANDLVDVFTPTPFLPDVAMTAPSFGPTSGDVTLAGDVNPAEAGNVTACRFSYVSNAAFEANDVNELQTLTLSGVTGGVFNLSLEGQSTSVAGSGDLTPGFHQLIEHVTASTGTFTAGEEIFGEGIPPGTTITYISDSEPSRGVVIILSNSVTGVGHISLTAALPYDAPSEALRQALAALSTIGTGNIGVSGAAGGPYTIEFKGQLSNTNLPRLVADSSNLTPQPGAEAIAATDTDGGDGWSTATEIPCLNEAGEAVDSRPITNSDQSTHVHANIASLTPEVTYHYRLAATDANGAELGPGRTFTPHVVIGLVTEPATDVVGEAATLNGSLLGDGTPTHYYFEWGKTTAYGSTAPESPAPLGSPSGPNSTLLSNDLMGLSPNTTYHFRVIAENGAGETSRGEDQSFTTPADLPAVIAESVGHVRSDSAVFQGQIDPGSGDTSYHVEYGTEECSTSACSEFPVPGLPIGNGAAPVVISEKVTGMIPSTTYHYRLVAQSVAGTTRGPERTFTTLPFVRLEHDTCPNSHVRQQTSAAGLPDCRAYELVSAANAGGYDVESNVVPGQTPFGGYPEAPGRVLYGVHDGGIPGTNHPTNRGVDPYVATRGVNGWSTEYVGIPANDPFSSLPFSSNLLEADAGLRTFAFGGEAICSPCFEDGSTGNPIRLPDGELVQGMTGSGGTISNAQPAGFVEKHLSADGSHFVFGSISQFAPDGNHNGDVSIYDRNLKTGQIHVVSKTPTGETMTGSGIGELDIAADGSRIVVGRLVSKEGSAKYWHLYMDIGDSEETVDLTPGSSSGVLYDGMTADGSRVFFTTKDPLVTSSNQDTDNSADIYEAEVDSAGNVTLTRVSTGIEGTGNTDECEPAGNSANRHWNTTAPEEEDCGVVAVGGGGGVAAQDGAFYFLSPEKLDGSAHGTQNAPNLYLARLGQPPHYVATLESTLSGPQPPRRTRFFEGNLGSFTTATGIAVDHASKDVYVLDLGNEETPATVQKFDSSGHPVNFSASTPYIEGNKLTGTESGPFGELAELDAPTQLAVDQSNGRLYVPNLFSGAIDVFASSGEYLFEIEGLAFPSGVSIDPANGDVYVSSFFGEISIFEPSGTPLTSFSGGGFGVVGVAADASGDAYVTNSFADTTQVYDSSGNFIKTLDENSPRSVAVDPASGEVYVDEGSQIAIFDSSDHRLGTLGSGVLTGSIGLGVDGNGALYASTATGSLVAGYSPLQLLPSPLIDSPLVIHSVGEPGTRHTSDFQVTPNGEFAAFATTANLTGYESGEAAEIYRYEPSGNAGSGQIECASCDPTGGEAEGASSLASNGLSLTEDGRIFFTTSGSLVSGDTDGIKDVYEWEPLGVGNCEAESPTFNPAASVCLGLISAGTSAFDSALLGVDASGRDAYFFTRDSLVPEDVNGPTMKIYDAREEGGSPFLFPPAGCRASDECHGAASPPPGPQELSSESGTSHNFHPGCRRHFVRKHGKCVRMHRTHKHRRRGHHKRGGKR